MYKVYDLGDLKVGLRHLHFTCLSLNHNKLLKYICTQYLSVYNGKCFTLSRLFSVIYYTTHFIVYRYQPFQTDL